MQITHSQHTARADRSAIMVAVSVLDAVRVTRNAMSVNVLQNISAAQERHHQSTTSQQQVKQGRESLRSTALRVDCGGNSWLSKNLCVSITVVPICVC